MTATEAPWPRVGAVVVGGPCDTTWEAGPRGRRALLLGSVTPQWAEASHTVDLYEEVTSAGS